MNLAMELQVPMACMSPQKWRLLQVWKDYHLHPWHRPPPCPTSCMRLANLSPKDAIAKPKVFVVSKNLDIIWQGSQCCSLTKLITKAYLLSCSNLDVDKSKDVVIVMQWPNILKTCFWVIFSTKLGIVFSTIYFWFGNTTQRIWCKSICCRQWFSTTRICI